MMRQIKAPLLSAVVVTTLLSTVAVTTLSGLVVRRRDGSGMGHVAHWWRTEGSALRPGRDIILPCYWYEYPGSNFDDLYGNEASVTRDVRLTDDSTRIGTEVTITCPTPITSPTRPPLLSPAQRPWRGDYHHHRSTGHLLPLLMPPVSSPRPVNIARSLV